MYAQLQLHNNKEASSIEPVQSCLIPIDAHCGKKAHISSCTDELPILHTALTPELKETVAGRSHC